MFRARTFGILLSLSIGLVSEARAEPTIGLGEPSFEGYGCKSGMVGVALSPDSQTLSVLFDDYNVEVGSNLPTDKKTCRLFIPITIPRRHALMVIRADYRGYNSLPKGASTILHTNYDFRGDTDPKERRLKEFKGPLEDEFFHSETVRTDSKCGGQDVFEIDTKLIVTTNRQGDRAFSQLDTLDIKTHMRRRDRKISYQIRLVECNP